MAIKSEHHLFEKAMGYMMISSSFIAVLNLCVKLAVQEISPWQLSFLRSFAPLLLLLFFLLGARCYKLLKPKIPLKLHLIRSFFAAIAQLSLTYYLTKASLVDATMLWCIGPLFIPLLAKVFFKQKILPIVWVSLGIGLLGVGFIIKPTTGIFDPFSLYGLFAGVAMAFSQVFWGGNAEKGGIFENLFYLFFFSSVILCVPQLFLWKEASASLYSWQGALLVLAIALCSLGNQFFRGRAYSFGKPYLLAPLLYISVFFSAGFDWLIFKITPDAWSVVGFLLVILSLYLKWRWSSKALKRPGLARSDL